MSLLENQYKTALQIVDSKSCATVISASQLIETIDLTLLNKHPDQEVQNHFIHRALTQNIAAICVFSSQLPLFNKPAMTLFERATVVNFPKACNPLDDCLAEVAKAQSYGATEIDYVFDYQHYLGHNQQVALEHFIAIKNDCHQRHLTLKVILETEMFPDLQTIYHLSQKLIFEGCDFIKTSTGTLPTGATLYAAFAILQAIKESGYSCGIKISGGIKHPEQARNYVYLAELIMEKTITKDWFRIGASSLLEALVKP